MPELKLQMNDSTVGPADNRIPSAAVHSDFLPTNYVDFESRPSDEHSHKGGQTDKNQ